MKKVVAPLAKQQNSIGKTLILILLFCISLLIFAFCLIDCGMYLRLKFVCTAEVTGVVDEIKTGFVKSTDQTELRFVHEGENKMIMRIAIDPDSGFGKDCVYANCDNENLIGTEMTVYYSPDDPFDHYIGSLLNTCKNTLILTAVSGAALIILFLLLLKTKKQKPERQPQTPNIYFDSPFCRFYYYGNNIEAGYEGNVKWTENAPDQTDTDVFLEVDIPDADTSAAIDAVLQKYTDANAPEIPDVYGLADQFAAIRAILPVEAYSRAERILSDRQRVDYEIRISAADYFLRKPALIKENTDVQTLMDGMSLTFIGFYRNGNTEFSIPFNKHIYVDDLHIVIKADGTKEIRYKPYEADDECCEIIP